MKEGDVVKHKLNGKKYVILSINPKKSFLDSLTSDNSDSVYCLNDKGEKGYLSKQVLEVVK